MFGFRRKVIPPPIVEVPVPKSDVQAIKSLGFDFENPSVPMARGAYGHVYRGKCNEFAKQKPFPCKTREETAKTEREEVSLEGMPCAIKMSIIEPIGDSSRQREMLYSEAQVLEELRHPCLAQVYLIFKSGPHRVGPISTQLSQTRIYFIMEYINGGTLFDRMSLGRANFNQDEAVQIIIQLTIGLQYLHSQGVAHGDLHTGNIMFHRDQDNNYHCKIVDLGCTKQLVGFTKWLDIMNYVQLVVKILSKSDFSNVEWKQKLRLFTDRITQEKMVEIDVIEREIFKILGQQGKEAVAVQSESATASGSAPVAPLQWQTNLFLAQPRLPLGQWSNHRNNFYFKEN